MKCVGTPTVVESPFEHCGQLDIDKEEIKEKIDPQMECDWEGETSRALLRGRVDARLLSLLRQTIALIIGPSLF